MRVTHEKIYDSDNGMTFKITFEHAEEGCIAEIDEMTKKFFITLIEKIAKQPMD